MDMGRIRGSEPCCDASLGANLLECLAVYYAGVLHSCVRVF